MSSNQQTCLIGLDLGTSAIKGVVTDTAGTVHGTTEMATRYCHPRDGWVEADAQGWLADVFTVIRQLAANAPGPVRALAAAAASGNTLLVDHDGRPLTTIINWMDQRCAGNSPAALRGLSAEEVRQVTGWPCVDSFPLAHLAWLRENRSDDFSQADRICMNTDWLLFKLTGRWVMDHSTATTFHIQDQTAGAYHPPYLERLGIDESNLSMLTDSGVAAGAVTAEAAAAGLPVDAQIVTGCFDHPAAARAVGVTEAGQLMLSCGTSWVGFFPEPDRQKIVDADLLCDPFLSERGGCWGAMFSVPAIGGTIDAYVRRVIAPGEPDPYDVFNHTAADAPPGAEGLTIDLREPWRAIDADRRLVSRAVMEGAARLLNDELQARRSHGFTFKRAVMVGGPAESPTWPGIVAEMTGLEVAVGRRSAGAEGAAMLAAAAITNDEFPNDDSISQ